MLNDFKAFVLRGNVVDLAVAVIIGGAFGKIVTSFVNDIIMPPVGLLLGKVDFSNLFINFSDQEFNSLADAQAAGAPILRYGIFLNTVLDFLIVAFAIFVVIRLLSRLRRTPPPPEPDTRECPQCLSIIPRRATRCAHCTAAVNPL